MIAWLFLAPYRLLRRWHAAAYALEADGICGCGEPVAPHESQCGQCWGDLNGW